MADREKNTGDFRVALKHLQNYDNLNNLKLKTIANVLKFCADFFASNPRSQFQKDISLPFSVYGFPGRNFKLRQAGDIARFNDEISFLESQEEVEGEEKNQSLENKKRARDKFIEENLFLSDLVNFVNEAKVGLVSFLNTEDGKNAIKAPPNNVFTYFSVNEFNDEISLNELKRIEDDNEACLQLVEYIKRITEAAKKDGVRAIEPDAIEEAPEETVKASAGPSITSIGKSQQDADDAGGEGDEASEEEQKSQEEKKKEEPLQPQSTYNDNFNLAQLDDRSKLYMRSMAIITINESLRKLDPSGKLTFDQLDPQARQQLMTIAFGKVETLLAGGQYSLDKAINNIDVRSNLASEASLDLLIDVRGSRILAKQAKTILNPQTPNLAKENKDKAINPQDIKERLKIDANNPEIANFSGVAPSISSVGAQSFFDQLDGDDAAKAEFVNQLGKTLGSVNDDDLAKYLAAMAEEGIDKDNVRYLVKTNVAPAIQTLIQQGYPAEYIKNLNYQQVAFYFGDQAISKSNFEKYEPQIKRLLETYWRSKRANWGVGVHKGIADPLYSEQDAQNIWNEAIGDEKKLENYWSQFQLQGKLNQENGGEIVARVLAGESINNFDLDPETKKQLSDFKNQYNQAFLDQINSLGRGTQEIVYAFYEPGQTLPGGEIVLNASTLPQFSVYDWGALQANSIYGANTFGHTQGGATLQNAKNLYNHTLGKGVNFLADKGIEAGLTYLTGGAYAAIPKPLRDGLTKFLRQIGVENIKKILPILLLIISPIVAGLLALLKNLASVAKFFGISTGKEIAGGVLGGKTGATQESLAAKQKLGAKAAAESAAKTGSGSIIAPVAKSAMATAGQALIATVSLTVTVTFLYNFHINNAFLTDFPAVQQGTSAPMNESEYLKIEKELDGKEHYENAEVAGGIDLLYTITITPKEGEIKILDLTDKVSIRSKGTPDEPEIERVGDEEIPETIDEPLELQYKISGIDSAYADTAITNQITIKAAVGAANEIDELSDSAMVKIGEPPVPEGVALALLIVETLQNCAGGVVTRSNLTHAEQCLRDAGVPETSIAEMTYSVSNYVVFQCVGFARTLQEMTNVTGVGFAGQWCDKTWSGFSKFSSPGDWDPYLEVGDYVIQPRRQLDNDELTAGHIAYVVERIGDQVTIAEAMGGSGSKPTDGLVRTRTLGIATFVSGWCAFFKPN